MAEGGDGSTQLSLGARALPTLLRPSLKPLSSGLRYGCCPLGELCTCPAGAHGSWESWVPRPSSHSGGRGGRRQDEEQLGQDKSLPVSSCCSQEVEVG